MGNKKDCHLLMTGLFKTAEELANALKLASSKLGWNIHEREDTTDFDPYYRIYTGLFGTKSEAENGQNNLEMPPVGIYTLSKLSMKKIKNKSLILVRI
ncbi:hypothetical protein GCM10008025_02890 [Ornithinibacillus halotolerans]|uniref:SPOR domain-containing protein n=1 Tax=Ornithinibacillus halotolerans TaxID=1274357 RepID=A0A916RM48_9BACI|nr:hypothetical protein GCM10008025_02890 [Ornithinibacillus halotolerans]